MIKYLLILVIFFSSCSEKIPDKMLNEPNGFRGFKWNSSYETFPNLKVIPTSPEDIKLFKKLNVTAPIFHEIENDNLLYEGVKLESISYSFSSGRFYAVNLSIESEADFKKLKDFCFKKFGPSRQHPRVRGQESFHWKNGIQTFISLEEHPGYFKKEHRVFGRLNYALKGKGNEK
jgi:hypothetical protein